MQLAGNLNRLGRPITALLVLVFGLVSLFGASSQAFAGRAVCRTDPVIVLSDGAVMEVRGTIETDLSNLGHVEYVVHVPKGVRAVAIVYTDILPKIDEHVTIVADRKARSYSTDTTFSTVDGSSVPATLYAMSNLLDWRSAPGLTNSPITIDFDAKK